MAAGKPVVLDPAVDIPAINAANARCFEEHGGDSRAETMAFSKAHARELVQRVRTLEDSIRGATMPGDVARSSSR